MDEVAELMKEKAAGLKVVLKIDRDESLASIICDPDAIHRCLLNLVTNALEACTEKLDSPETREVRLQSRAVAEGGVEYRVTDNCGGIPPAHQEKLFNPFFSTKGRTGTGIGLMLTKKIVDKHGGEIGVQSTADKTDFTIRLPARGQGAGTLPGN